MNRYEFTDRVALVIFAQKINRPLFQDVSPATLLRAAYREAKEGVESLETFHIREAL
jgi:hypothetical protein